MMSGQIMRGQADLDSFRGYMPKIPACPSPLNLLGHHVDTPLRYFQFLNVTGSSEIFAAFSRKKRESTTPRKKKIMLDHIKIFPGASPVTRHILVLFYVK